jgi:hypothetical protein
VSTNKADIQQIQKYLKGELDAKAMHALEKQAQSDPFLMDAIEGYQNTATDQQANFEDIKARFGSRIEQDTKRIIPLWRYLTIAASVLLIISFGILWLKPKHAESPVALAIAPAQADQKNQTASSGDLQKADKVAQPTAASVIQTNHITGIVTDPTGHTLAGVKVKLKGTKLTAKTDSNGVFSIASIPVKGTLSIANTGYYTKQVRLKGSDSLKVILNESANELASVSVTAFVDDDKPAHKTHPSIGWRAFRDYLQKNAVMPNGETGLVKLAFTVSANGIINGIRVIRGNNEEMNQRAIDLVLNGPVWKSVSDVKEMRLKIQFRKPKDS